MTRDSTVTCHLRYLCLAHWLPLGTIIITSACSNSLSLLLWFFSRMFSFLNKDFRTSFSKSTYDSRYVVNLLYLANRWLTANSATDSYISFLNLSEWNQFFLVCSQNRPRTRTVWPMTRRRQSKAPQNVKKRSWEVAVAAIGVIMDSHPHRPATLRVRVRRPLCNDDLEHHRHCGSIKGPEISTTSLISVMWCKIWSHVSVVCIIYHQETKNSDYFQIPNRQMLLTIQYRVHVVQALTGSIGTIPPALKMVPWVQEPEDGR